MKFKQIAGLSLLCASLASGALASETHTEGTSGVSQQKQRLIVLSDIEADPDDTQSFIRLFLYANEIDIEAMVATTSVHQKTFVAPDSIRDLIKAYGAVQPNLRLHDKAYPTADTLAARVSSGQPIYGIAGVGKGHDTPGSTAIIRALDADDPRPVWVSVWGGANTLAQALFTLRETRSAAELETLIRKLRVYTISDQDDTGAWIRKTFPTLFYVVSPGGYGNATWGGLSEVVPGFENTEISNAWITDNIQQGHGALGAKYPDVGYGAEGDTPSFLWLIPNGLNAPDHPDWGGWGGRYKLYTPSLSAIDPQGFTGGVPVEAETRPMWTNAIDRYRPYVANAFGRNVKPAETIVTGYKTTIWRWRAEFQNDFAARMDWTIKPVSNANHPPVPSLGHPDVLNVKSGEGFTLSAAGTTDPDGDNLSYLWFNYPEAGTLTEPVPINSAENLYRAFVKAPVVTKPETAHFILKVTDKGSPPLTRYKRVIVNITP